MSDVKNILTAGCLFIIGTFVLLLCFSGINAKTLSECETQPGVELTIVNKHQDSRNVYTGKTFIRTTTYYLDLEFEPGVTTQIVCTSSEYNTLQIGDSVLCTILYNKDNEIMKVLLE